MTLLDRWRRVTNLISEDGFRHVWSRHVDDSIALQQSCPSSCRWLDIGSGAGFPAIVVGVLLIDRLSAHIHCVESDARKCAFLRTVVRELDLPVKIHNIRIEALGHEDIGPVDVVTARAFSPIRQILDLSEPFLSQGAVVLLPRGEHSLREVEALDHDRYTVKVDPNPTHASGVIIRIEERRRPS